MGGCPPKATTPQGCAPRRRPRECPSRLATNGRASNDGLCGSFITLPRDNCRALPTGGSEELAGWVRAVPRPRATGGQRARQLRWTGMVVASATHRGGRARPTGGSEELAGWVRAVPRPRATGGQRARQLRWTGTWPRVRRTKRVSTLAVADVHRALRGGRCSRALGRHKLCSEPGGGRCSPGIAGWPMFPRPGSERGGRARPTGGSEEPADWVRALPKAPRDWRPEGAPAALGLVGAIAPPQIHSHARPTGGSRSSLAGCVRHEGPSCLAA
jgi:hypothetical protein